MITIYSYNIAEGTLDQPTLEKLPDLVEAENVDLWVDLESPNLKESEILSTVFGFHELAIEDCTAVDIEEAKLDDYEDYLFLVLHSVLFSKDNMTFDTNEVDLFFGKNFVVTYHKQPTPGIKRAKKRLEKSIDFMGQGSDEILHAIIDSLVDNYMVSFKKLERTVLEIETEILSEPSKETFNSLFRLKRGLINLRRYIAPEVAVIDSLGTTEHDLIQEDNQIYFQDIHDHVSNIEGRLGSFIEMVTGTMDTYMTITQHRMNVTMQALTVFATMVLFPTLIASVYGMNFEWMPLLHNKYGFLIVMGGTFCSVCLVWLYFKKQKWF